MPLIFRLPPLMASMLLTLPLAHAQAPTPPLNDTGIVWSGDAEDGNAESCSDTHPAGQDCHYGRDANAIAGTLDKTGHSDSESTNGFDFTKILNSGEETDLEAWLGPEPNDWACTRDNVTGLIWEVKVDGGDDDHPRSAAHAYTWYNPASPDGNTGSEGGTGSCAESLGDQPCNTANYITAVNEAGLCGFNDWRMPTIKELESIVDFGRQSAPGEDEGGGEEKRPTARDALPGEGLEPSTAIDPTFFPNTVPDGFWSGTPYSGNNARAWSVNFENGSAHADADRTSSLAIRLVRGPGPTPE